MLKKKKPRTLKNFEKFEVCDSSEFLCVASATSCDAFAITFPIPKFLVSGSITHGADSVFLFDILPEKCYFHSNWIFKIFNWATTPISYVRLNAKDTSHTITDNKYDNVDNAFNSNALLGHTCNGTYFNVAHIMWRILTYYTNTLKTFTVKSTNKNFPLKLKIDPFFNQKNTNKN